jgi:ATP-dependent helicase HrpA
MHGGVSRLVLLALALNRPSIERRLSNRQRLDVVGAGLDLGAVIEDCAVAAIDRVLAGHGLPWDERSFADLVAASKAEVPDAVNAGVASVAGLAARHGRITRRLDELVAPALQPAVADVRAQLRRLIRPGFVAAAGLRRLADVDRYLQAIEHRLGRIGEHAARDRQQMADLQAIERRYTAVLATLGRGPVPAEVIDLGWQLEELRVATFAQQVGATKGVSVTRVVRALAQLEAPGRRT